MFDSNWYLSLNKPLLSPPNWVFSPVWALLYLSMFISLFLYAKKQAYKNKSRGYILFFTQLFINFTWTPAFFGLKNITLALAIIILLDILVLLNIIEFYKISKSAGRFLIPYFIWIIFATYLNFSYLLLN